MNNYLKIIMISHNLESNAALKNKAFLDLISFSGKRLLLS